MNIETIGFAIAACMVWALSLYLVSQFAYDLAYRRGMERGILILHSLHEAKMERAQQKLTTKVGEATPVEDATAQTSSP